MPFLFKNRSMLVFLFNKDLDWGAAAESSSSLTPAQRGSLPNAVGAASGTIPSMYDTEAKRSTHTNRAALETIAESSATIVTGSQKIHAVMTVRDMLAVVESASPASSSPALIERL